MKKYIASVVPLMIMIALVPAAQAKQGSTKVEIKTVPSLYGYVKSSKPARCAAGRRVSVFKEKPGKDVLIAGTKTKKNGGGWQWSIVDEPKGRVYAKAHKKSGCRSGRSRSVSAGLVGDIQPPECPGRVIDVCELGELKFESLGCGFYLHAIGGDCDGPVSGTSSPVWTQGEMGGTISWAFDRDEGSKYQRWFTYQDEAGNATLIGAIAPGGDEVPEGGWAVRFSVGFARTNETGRTFCTPDLPGKGRGELGGPLELRHRFFPGNYEHVRVSMSGFLFLKGAPGGC